MTSIFNKIACLILLIVCTNNAFSKHRHHRQKFMSPPAPGKYFNKVLTIVLENADYDVVIAHPYFAQLKSQGTLLTNFRGVAHPSYPNYISMAAGNTQGIITNIIQNVGGLSIADLLEARGYTWKNYAEGFPGNCYLGDKTKRYVRRHVPFINFKKIQNDPNRCKNIVNAVEFEKDRQLNQLPNYAFYTPDMDNDGHDTGIHYSSQWLTKFLNPLLADSTFMKDTLVILTYDESEGYLDNNHIFTMLLGPMVKTNFVDSQKYNHYNLLKTIESNFGLPSMQSGDGKAAALTSVWK